MTHCMQCQDCRFPCTCELSTKDNSTIGVDISSRLNLRWSESDYLEVQTIGGWQCVYPLLTRSNKKT